MLVNCCFKSNSSPEKMGFANFRRLMAMNIAPRLFTTKSGPPGR